MINGKTDIERLDAFLIYIANKKDIGVRRKIVSIQQFINKLAKNNKYAK